MKMRAARMVESGRMVCEDAEVRPPGEGELLVRNDMASLCGSDLHQVMMGFGLPEFPQAHGFPGHEGIGVVAESRDQRFKQGDRVLTVPQPPASYCFAEYQTLPADFCIDLPPDGESAHLLMAQQLGTVIFALRHHPVDLVGKSAMVMGQGSAGIFFATLLNRAGVAQVIVSDLSEARLAVSRRMGADLALKANGDNVRESVMAATGGEGVDFLVEAVGTKETLLETVDLVRPGAEMVLFGLPDRFEPVPISFAEFFRKKVLAYSTYGAQFEPGLKSFRAAVDLIHRGEIDVSPLVSHSLPIEEIDKALHMAHERTDSAIKVSLRFDGG